MRVNITYPQPEKRKRQRQDVIDHAKWPFLLAGFVCAVVNIATGGPAWSLIAIWSLWMAWSFVIAPDLVEYNRISFWIRLITSISILLIIIDALFPLGWSLEVVPIIFFAGLTIAGILFFTDLERQKQNMLPMLALIALSLLASLIGLLFWRAESHWTLIVLGVIALTLLAACIMVMGGDFLREVRKRLHTR